MTVLPNVANVIRVSCHMTIGGKPDNISRFFISYTGTAPTNADLNTFAGTVRAAYNTNLKSLAVASVVLTSVECVDLTTLTSAQGSDSTSVAGTRAGSGNVGSASVVISYAIARRYRGGHARGYWPFGSNADLQTQQNWLAALQTAVATGFAAFMTAVKAGGWSGAGTLGHVAVSYYSGSHVVTNPTTGRARNVPDFRATPLVSNVSQNLVRSIVGSQRRRERT